MSTRRTTILTILVGASSGFAGAVLASLHAGTPAPGAYDRDVSVSVQKRPGTELSTFLNDNREQRLAALEARLQAREEARAQQPGDPTTDPGFEPQDVEAAREETIAQWEDQLQAHAEEAVDHSWAGTTARAFEEDVRGLAGKHQFELLDAKCKSKTCSVTVQWADYGQALGNYAALLHHPYRTGCMREVLLPEPENRERPYRATVLYDCSALRGGS